jgi:cytochrome b561
MAAEATPRSYDLTLRTLHWLMAALVLLAIALGAAAALLPAGVGARPALLFVHKSLGMTALVLVVLRVGCRLAVGAPPYGDTLGALMQAAARGEQAALYALMAALPVTGYVTSTAGGHEVSWFGLFAWPAVVAPDKALASRAAEAHLVLAWAVGALVALHLAAAAWHYWVKRDDIFARMWPSAARTGGGRG